MKFSGAVYFVILVSALSASAEVVEVKAPGPIRDARGAEGLIWAIVDETEGEEPNCVLFSAQIKENATFKRVRETSCTAVLSRLDPADGETPVVVISDQRGGIVLASTGEILLADPDFEGARVPETFVKPGRFCLATLGELQCFSIDAELSVVSIGVAELPIVAHRSADGLSLRSAQIDPVRGVDNEFATWPEARGPSRQVVHHIIIDPKGNHRVVECWLRLPGPEMVHDVWYVSIEGEAYAILTTTPSDKLEVFGEKLLRIFPLRSDRTRWGVDPIFAIKTEMNLWQSGPFELVDVSGDGLEDLVFAYWKGLRKARLALDVYLGIGGRRWQDKARSSGLAFDEAERWFLNLKHDIDGDGTGDLVVLADDRLQVFSRKISASGKNTLVKDPLWTSAPLPKGDQPSMEISVGNSGVAAEQLGNHMIAFDDVINDGRVEILLVFENSVFLHWWPRTEPAS